MPRISQWCCVGFGDLFDATEGREPTPTEKAAYNTMSVDERNSWVLERICQSRGTYVAIDERGRTGFVTFSTIEGLLRSLATREMRFPVGKTEEELPYTVCGGRHGFTVDNPGDGSYHVTSWWDHGNGDVGRTSAEIDARSNITNLHTTSDQHGRGGYGYNWQEGSYREGKP